MPDDRTGKLEKIEGLVRDWVGKQGHDQCWYYPDILRAIASELGIEYVEPNLPSEDDFRRGCERYRGEVYSRVTCDGKQVEETRKV